MTEHPVKLYHKKQRHKQCRIVRDLHEYMRDHSGRGCWSGGCWSGGTKSHTNSFHI